MPEYVYPGVYVEELGAPVRPIPGVLLDDAALKAIATDLRRSIAAYLPQPHPHPHWTGSNESDPGIALLELLAFLGESLRFRSAGARDGSGLERPVFFAGRLLDAAALSQEQEYQQEKRRRHNLALIGSGVVSGLGVAVAVEPDGVGGSEGPRVVVEPGHAIDPRGEEVSVPCQVTLAPPRHGDAVFVTIRYWERVCAQFTIEEACILGIAGEVVSPALGLARLVRGDAGWGVDTAFAVARIQR